MKYYTIKEVKKHNKNNDCWLIANNKVYDVTSFLNKHLIGSHAIIKKAGTDCTIDYNFHSKASKKIWEKYLIGYIENNKCCCIVS